VYQQGGATGAPEGAPGGNGSSGNGSGAASSDDVIDAEFTESK
jgi:hypothetical protein